MQVPGFPKGKGIRPLPLTRGSLGKRPGREGPARSFPVAVSSILSPLALKASLIKEGASLFLGLVYFDTVLDEGRGLGRAGKKWKLHRDAFPMRAGGSTLSLLSHPREALPAALQVHEHPLCPLLYVSGWPLSFVPWIFSTPARM